jgi:hypothetical protein
MVPVSPVVAPLMSGGPTRASDFRELHQKRNRVATKEGIGPERKNWLFYWWVVLSNTPHQPIWVLFSRDNTADFCYDSKLITAPKTSHIKTISAISPTPAISADPGKIYTEMMRATHHPYKIFDLINYYSHNLSPV